MTTPRTRVADPSESRSHAETQATLLSRCNDILVKHEADQVKRTIPVPYNGNRPVIGDEGVPDTQPKPSIVWLTRSGSDSYDLTLLCEGEPIGLPVINRPEVEGLPDLSPGKEYAALKLGLGANYEGGIGLFGWNGTDWELVEGLAQAGLAEGGQSDEETLAKICTYSLQGSTTERSAEPVHISHLGNAALILTT